MRTILIVEDNSSLLLGLKTALKMEGFSVRTAQNLLEARNEAVCDINLILLDLNLPDGDGLEFCRYVKELYDIPIIILTVRDDEKDMIGGLGTGADDYVTKPFKMSVLTARIQTVLRRAGRLNIPGDQILCKELRLIKSSTKVYRSGQELSLTPGEYQLLLTFLENKNRTLNREYLLERLWDSNGEFVNDNTLTTLIKRLREKIEKNPQLPEIIKTVRGFGYQAVDTDE